MTRIDIIPGCIKIGPFTISAAYEGGCLKVTTSAPLVKLVMYQSYAAPDAGYRCLGHYPVPVSTVPYWLFDLTFSYIFARVEAHAYIMDTTTAIAVGAVKLGDVA